MNIQKKIQVILLIGLFFVSCGDNHRSKQNTIVSSSNLPTIILLDKEQSKVEQKETLSEVDMIKNNVHELSWAYYQEERSTTVTKNRRWFISNASSPYIFSLMPIENSQAGWAEVSLTAGQVNLDVNTISIGDIPNKSTCSYYDRGLNQEKENCIIKDDVSNIKNSTVAILWWFFQASNGSWYIMGEGHTIAYKFAGDEDGQYDWTHTVDIGVTPTLFVENGIKKMKFVTASTNENLIGIDVSKHNGSVNWEAVKNDGVSFAFIKATEGYPETDYEWSHQYSENFLDTKFENNMNKAIEEGLLVAPYHFIRVDYNEKTSDAIEEAKYFVSKIKPYYENNKLLPPVIDIENPPTDKENPSNKNQIARWSKLEFTDWIRSFAYEVENQLGVKPILYMNESFSNNEVESNLFDSYELWIAKYLYSSENGTVINSLDDLETYESNFKPNRDYLFWQFTETAVDIDGLNGFVDKNIFQGTLDDLKKYLVDFQTNPSLTSISPSEIPVGESDSTLTLYGKNLKNIQKIFIAGVDIESFSVYNESYIKIETTQTHGANLAYGVPFGYRDVIVKFENGSQVVLKNQLKVIEDDIKIKSVQATPSSGNAYAQTNEDINFKVLTSGKNIQVYIHFFDGYKYLDKDKMNGGNGVWTFRRAIKNAGNRKYKVTIEDLNGNLLKSHETYIEVKESILTANSLMFPSDTSQNKWSHTSGSRFHKITSYAGNNFNDTHALDLNLNYPSYNSDKGKIVRPIANGKVIIDNSYYGFILIEHNTPLKLDDGTKLNIWYSGYMHMNNLTNLTNVTTASTLGNISRTGGTNDHLHFVIYTLINGRYTSIDIRKNLSSFVSPITGWY